MYDIGENKGYVNAGTSRNTARFAADSIRRWWECMGRHVHEGAEALYITADETGLNVTAESSKKKYALGEDVRREFAKLNILRHDFHPEWNYLIRPRKG